MTEAILAPCHMLHSASVCARGTGHVSTLDVAMAAGFLFLFLAGMALLVILSGRK